MERIAVIGIGPGDEAGMTIEAAREITRADAVYAARRHALLAGEGYLPLEPLGAALDGMYAQWEKGAHIAVLVSGDASLYSLLPLMVRRFGRENLRVTPGVGALQALCAALCEPWQGAAILSAHGRALSESALVHAVRTHARTFLFCDAKHGPRWACDALARAGYGAIEVAVGERLCYPDARVSTGNAEKMREGTYDGLSLVRFLNPVPVSGLPPIGVEDDAFVRGKTPMTKREIRALVVAALRLRPDSVVWDVGAGTGSVSIECANQCPTGRVYAIECDADACGLIQKNAEKFHAANLEIVPGEAPGALAGLAQPTSVFLGGTGGGMDAIIAQIEGMGRAVRLVATAVTLESVNGLTGRLSGWKNLGVSQIAVTRLEPVGRYRMFKAQNPVFLISADWEECT